MGHDFSLEELATIYQTGWDIERYVDGLTGGKGLAWMNKYLGGIGISHWGDGVRGATYPWNHIYLGSNWMNGAWPPNQLIAHELGHVWDIRSGNSLGIGGGVGDDLMWAVSGDPRASIRFWYRDKGDSVIPLNARWDKSVNGGYGNGDINEYAAESFSWSVYDPDNLPSGSDEVVQMVVDQTIRFQANSVLP